LPNEEKSLIKSVNELRIPEDQEIRMQRACRKQGYQETRISGKQLKVETLMP
jgi:hypothetical protein